MKKFNDLKKGDVLLKDSSNNDVIMLYIVDDFQEIEEWVDLTYIKIYENHTEIGDGIIFDKQTWNRNEFDRRFIDMPENSLKEKMISGIMGKIEWT